MSSRGRSQNKKTPAKSQSQSNPPRVNTHLTRTDGHASTSPLGDIAAGTFLPGEAPLMERRIQVSQTSFNGPIPHPEIFRQYGEVVPDAPERILRVFEEDSKHVRDIAREALSTQRAENRRLQWMAWSLIATGIVGGYAMSGLFAWMNKDGLATAVLTVTIIGTVSAFLQGISAVYQKNKDKKKSQKEEDSEED